ncbi:hypothetical protein AMECASPLE_017914 [Ameca splendens]|uniref:Uncharacterized protein n=1 Tax=Ameca splendens TaxID=208324 RepID=A0ABV0YDV4_9TELE
MLRLETIDYRLGLFVNATTKALTGLSTEVTALRTVVLQNGMVLDLLTASVGGVCALLNETCSTYIPNVLPIYIIWRSIGNAGLSAFQCLSASLCGDFQFQWTAQALRLLRSQASEPCSPSTCSSASSHKKLHQHQLIYPPRLHIVLPWPTTISSSCIQSRFQLHIYFLSK